MDSQSGAVGPPQIVAATAGSEAYGRLGDAVRRLVDAAFAAGHCDDDTLDALASELDEMADRMDAAVAGAPDDGALPRIPYGHNPMSPTLDIQRVDDHFEAVVRLGKKYEGPPTFVHGGWIAYAFDEVLGRSNASGSFPGMTAELTIRYRRPTPLGAEAQFSARIVETEGRRSVLEGELRVSDEVTCEARAVFVRLRPETAEAYYGDRSRIFLGTDDPTFPDVAPTDVD